MIVHTEVLFASVPVAELARSTAWYARLFGRPCDIDVNEREVMWRVGEAAWLYLIHDEARAGAGLVAISVADLEAAVAELGQREVATGRIEREGDAGVKSVVVDPDGNAIALVQVTRSDRDD